MKYLRAISLSVVLVTMILFLAEYAVRKGDARQYIPRGYQVITKTSWHPVGMPPVLNSIDVRWVNSEGEWKRISYPASGKSPKVLLSSKSGVFRVNVQAEELQLLREYSDPNIKLRSVEGIKSIPGFHREDSLLGYKTYVIKKIIGGKDNVSVEFHISPEVGHIPLKAIIHRDAGDAVTEAISLTYMDVGADVISKPDLPVKLDFLNREIERYDEKGLREDADSLRSIIKRWQGKSSQ
ncbi:MAG: hypothetical protein SF097_12055 [Acidobacteriota bacterium]|nr:hypothetical protein [Acidobacteriota bacterium]